MGEPMTPPPDVFVRKLVDNILRGAKPERKRRSEVFEAATVE
jgi:hypothetical protein